MLTTCRSRHTRTLLHPAALASVPYGIVLVRVRRSSSLKVWFKAPTSLLVMRWFRSCIGTMFGGSAGLKFICIFRLAVSLEAMFGLLVFVWLLRVQQQETMLPVSSCQQWVRIVHTTPNAPNLTPHAPSATMPIRAFFNPFSFRALAKHRGR